MMEDKKRNRPTKVKLTLRILVSFYLLYLVWQLRGAPASHTGTERLLFLAAMALFTVTAVLLGGFSLRAYLRGDYEHPEDEESGQ